MGQTKETSDALATFAQDFSQLEAQRLCEVDDAILAPSDPVQIGCVFLAVSIAPQRDPVVSGIQAWALGGPVGSPGDKSCSGHTQLSDHRLPRTVDVFFVPVHPIVSPVMVEKVHLNLKGVFSLGIHGGRLWAVELGLAVEGGDGRGRRKIIMLASEDSDCGLRRGFEVM